MWETECRSSRRENVNMLDDTRHQRKCALWLAHAWLTSSECMRFTLERLLTFLTDRDKCDIQHLCCMLVIYGVIKSLNLFEHVHMFKCTYNNKQLVVVNLPTVITELLNTLCSAWKRDTFWNNFYPTTHAVPLFCVHVKSTVELFTKN